MSRVAPIGAVRVTVVTEVLESDDTVITSISETAEERGAVGNPLFVTRIAHRLTEEVSDRVREMLQPRYGEIDAEWRKS